MFAKDTADRRVSRVRVRIVVWRVLVVGVIAVGGCRATRVYTPRELGCGAGAYPGHPLQRGAARWPEPLLGIAQHAALHIGATDAAGGRPAAPLNVWIIQGADTLKARANAQGVAEFSALADGPAEVRAWFFNFVSTRDSVVLRTGFRDSMRLRLGRAGNECYIVPDTGRHARRRLTGP